MWFYTIIFKIIYDNDNDSDDGDSDDGDNNDDEILYIAHFLKIAQYAFYRIPNRI